MVYNREKAIAYAKKWALSRNPKYHNFDDLGGDCTNFISQCLYAGAPVMNFDKHLGWYYFSLDRRGPAWTSVGAFHRFLLGNKGPGPFGWEASVEEVQPGDFVQLATQRDYYHHSGIIMRKESNALSDITIACHTYDFVDRPLATYKIRQIRFIAIEGYRK